jgi:nitrite reductase/ring-hydroxylating ferredoxin subunit
VLTQEQNEALVRVEKDAPMGRLMRDHYWIPACLTSQLTPDGDPLRVRLLGKDYVAFRDTKGKLGFFDERCPHRGASLVLARNENCALTCIFHGWKFDADGKVIDVPTHAPNAKEFAARVKINKYETHEGGGIVWVWLGAQKAPTFPELPFTVLPERRYWMSITKAYCNWLQGVEATIDSAHIGTLHSAYMRSRPGGDRSSAMSTEDLAPIYEVERTDYGLAAIAKRKVGAGDVYVRTTQYLMPFIAFTPGGGEVPAVIFIVSPIDDHHHNLFYGVYSPYKDFAFDANGAPSYLAGVTGSLPYDPHNFGRFTGDRDANWGQNRQAMREGHFSGFDGNLIQEDMVTQASMGPIVDRTLDHLSSSDVGIVQAQFMLLEALRDHAAGKTPPGAGENLDFRHVDPENYVIPRGKSRDDKDGAVDLFKTAS